jgi:hypothetical protein
MCKFHQDLDSYSGFFTIEIISSEGAQVIHALSDFRPTHHFSGAHVAAYTEQKQMRKSKRYLEWQVESSFYVTLRVAAT